MMKHRCSEYLCKQFGVYHKVGPEHCCYMRFKPPACESSKLLVFFNLESQQDTGIHIPDLAKSKHAVMSVVVMVVMSVVVMVAMTRSVHTNYCGSRCIKCDKIDSYPSKILRMAL